MPFPSLGDPPDLVIVLVSAALAGRVFTTEPATRGASAHWWRDKVLNQPFSLTFLWMIPVLSDVYVSERNRGRRERENLTELNEIVHVQHLSQRALHIVDAQQIVSTYF